MKTYFTALTALLIGVMSISVVHAKDVAESESGLAQDIQQARTLLEADRRSLIAQNLQLAADNKFWKVYDDYRGKMIAINERRGKVIVEYADALSNDSLSGKQVAKLLDKSLNVFQDQIKVKKSFVYKFKKVLTPKEMVRFYQVDHRLDLLISAAIAKVVPLVEYEKEISE